MRSNRPGVECIKKLFSIHCTRPREDKMFFMRVLGTVRGPDMLVAIALGLLLTATRFSAKQPADQAICNSQTKMEIPH